MKTRKPPATPLAKFRHDSETSLDDAAKHFGVNKTTFWRWEAGKVSIPVARIVEFETFTGIPREQLRPDVFRGA
jgi:DNA-binding XRE family transcriptional regulator